MSPAISPTITGPIEIRAAAIADRLVPNHRAPTDDPAQAGATALQWQAAFNGSRIVLTERERSHG